ncbi:MAG: hypothetical protein KAX80_01410 [Planctomycetes bacterium]|nr:hypothetical protein [Planctomycetota bacterium]
MTLELTVPPILWTLALVTGAIAVLLLVAACVIEGLRNRRDGPVTATLERDGTKSRSGLWTLLLGLLGGLLGLVTGSVLSHRRSGPASVPKLWTLGWATAVIAVALLLAAWTGEEIRNRRHEPVRAAIERDLGFTLGTPFVKRNGLLDEVIMVMQVEPGKPMAEAGAEPRDVILGYTDTRDFFDDLQESRAASFGILAARDGKTLRLVVSIPP